MTNLPSGKKTFNIIVVVAALGYFVDIYDLILFSVVRKSSLESLGFSGNELLEKGVTLLNSQMIGMLLGGILWGILGDKKGRVSVLFGSIIMYSVANILNGMVTSFEAYKWMRFIAGVGLAGELGIGITLVSETMTKEKRGYGTMVVASFGILGAVLAAVVGKYFGENWQVAYYIGGIMGLLLLFLRIGVYESGMYKTAKEKVVKKGNFFQLFNSKKRFLKYLSCISVGLPIWFVIGILVTFSPELATALGVKEPIIAGTAIMYTYLGLSLGDLSSGYLSQLFKSRKKIIFAFLVLTGIFSFFYLMQSETSSTFLYTLCFALGLASGYWAVFVTVASEQFGTNIRSTVTTTAPNFVRGAVVPLTLSFNYLKGSVGIINSAMIVGIVTMAIAFVALLGIEETYGKELDYVEED